MFTYVMMVKDCDHKAEDIVGNLACNFTPDVLNS